MDKLINDSLLEYNVNQLEEVRSIYGYQDVKKLEQALDIFEDWILKQNHFLIKKYDKNYLERFIIANKGEVERAKRKLDKLCVSRYLLPDYLKDIKLEDEIKKIDQYSYFCILPKPTPSNHRIIFFQIKKEPVDDVFDLTSWYRYFYGMFQYLLCNDYSAGIDVIVDNRNINFGIVSKLNPITMHKGLTVLTECFGARLNSVHMISGTTFFQTVLNIVKQSMSDKLKKRIQVHNSEDTLYDFFPREILPQSVGGKERSIKEISELNYKVLTGEEHTKQMNFANECTSDESKRIVCQLNEDYLGMPGSFKVLCVD